MVTVFRGYQWSPKDEVEEKNVENKNEWGELIDDFGIACMEIAA